MYRGCPLAAHTQKTDDGLVGSLLHQVCSEKRTRLPGLVATAFTCRVGVRTPTYNFWDVYRMLSLDDERDHSLEDMGASRK